MIRRPSAILCAFVASCAVLAAQGTAKPAAPPAPPNQDPQQPTFRARVDSVSVDATVRTRTANR